MTPERAEEIARRKAEDIVYLGRGVSSGLADRRSNVEALEASKLPVLSTPADVAKALGLTIPQLRWLCFHTDAAEKTQPELDKAWEEWEKLAPSS